MPLEPTIYRDKGGGWRWRLVARNGQIVASSGEAYTRKWSAKRAAKRAAKLMTADV